MVLQNLRKKKHGQNLGESKLKKVDLGNKYTIDDILDKIMNNIAELIPSGMRGIYK